MSTERFGRYVIKAEVGRGGMASVFHAYDPRFERDIAIKVLPREFLHDPQFRTRFEREAKTIALLEHPAIVPVYDFGEEAGQPYIVMRYMSGGSLAERAAKGPLPLGEVVKTIARLAPALDAAHAKGIVHRDLKPGNILYDQYGNSFLSDFGIAHLTQSSSVTLTGGAILGTPAYMSPEQVAGGGTIDGRSDIYSMGVILYQMLAGKTPYQADTAAKLMMMHILEPVPHILDARMDLPQAFDEVIGKAMAKSPDDRFQTTEAMAEALEEAARSDLEETRLAGRQPLQAKPSTATIVAPPSKPPTPAQPVIAAITPPRGQPAPAKQKKAGIPLIALLIIFLVILLGAGGLGAGYIFLNSHNPANPKPSATLPLIAGITQSTPTQKTTDTPVPPTLPPQPSSTSQSAPTDTSAPTNTPAPTSTDTVIPPTPTETSSPLPTVPLVGGSDMMAFVRNNDIWLVNLDGTGLTQLTTDGGAKNDIQWTPDGKSIVFISGLCAKMVDYQTKRVDNIICFQYSGTKLDEFRISPDGSHVAISVNQELYVVPFDLAKLQASTKPSDIQNMADCSALGPYASGTGSAFAAFNTRWSADMQQLAVIQKIIYESHQEDAIRLLDISHCSTGLDLLDEFPGQRFRISQVTTLQNFAWDGFFNFAFVRNVRNDGFGDLYFYNSDLHQPNKDTNPIDKVCCYRDPSFSPDGSYLAFAFQDIREGAGSVTHLYYIQVGTLFTGLTYTPIPLPDGFFTNVKEGPQPILRPAANP